jgi:ribonuclease J
MIAVVTNKIKRLMNRLGEPGLIEDLVQHRAAMSADKLPATPDKWVIMARGSLLEDYAAKGVIPNEQDAWVWSMWKGYLEKESSRSLQEFFALCRKEYIHSSGHASPDVLQRFAVAMRADVLIPVHGEAWNNWQEHFPNLKIAANGEWLELNT